MERFALRNFVKVLMWRFSAAAVVFGVFLSLGRVKRMDLPVFSALLDSQIGFYASAFLTVGFLSLGWMGFQSYRG